MPNKMYIELKSDINLMTKMIFDQVQNVEQMLDAPISAEQIQKIKDIENLIDSLEVKIRSEIISTIVLYAPRATDLRKIIAYYDMNNHMEVIGDHLYNISKAMIDMDYDSKIYKESVDTIKEMFAKVKVMSKNAIFAAVNRDNKLSRNTILSDDEVDDLKDMLVAKLVNPSDLYNFQSAILLVRIAQIIERIGDAATSIAKSALFIIEGVDFIHENFKNENNGKI